MTSRTLELALSDFRSWFEVAVMANGQAPVASAPGVDVATLLGHYIALRQEVNLQTRAVRGQQEQNAEVLGTLGNAVQLLTRQQARLEQQERQGQEERSRPLLSSLIELHDALSLASREIQRTQEQVLPQLDEMAFEEPQDEPPVSPPPSAIRSFWSRWILSPSADAALRASQEETRRVVEGLQRERQERRDRVRRAAENAARVESALSSLVTGYAMSLERIERALRKHGLEPMPVVGRPFDPEQMEALETVSGSGRPAGEVVEEVRRGYLWNGRVFRFAQVRVARG